MNLQSNRPMFLALLLFCTGFPNHLLSDAAKICEAPIMSDLTVHTFVRMTYGCSPGAQCNQYPPFTMWPNVGFEKASWLPVGSGRLRDDSGESCLSWTRGYIGDVAAAASASQERKAIADLASAGWQNAGYGLQAGLILYERYNAPPAPVGCNPRTKSFNPRPGPQNVCWTFTCAYVSYLYQKLNVRPKSSSAITSQFSARSLSDVPSTWTCKPEQYGSGDGCQCTCGAFDPDCDPLAAVALDCPNRDDICTPGPTDEPVCSLRHTVLSSRKVLAIIKGTPIFDPWFAFTNDTDADFGGPWGNYSSAFTRSDVPSAWTCNSLFYGSNDGCDCNCGAWDPDCDATTGSKQRVLNCDTEDLQAQCVMSRTVPSHPVCLYDQMAANAAAAAGFSSPASPSQASTSTPVVIAASVGSTLGAVVLLAAITYFIRRRSRANRPMQAALL